MASNWKQRAIILWLPVLLAILSIVADLLCTGNTLYRIYCFFAGANISEELANKLLTRAESVKTWLGIVKYILFIIPIIITSYRNGYKAIKLNEYKKRLGRNYRLVLHSILLQDECISKTSSSNDLNIRIFVKKGSSLVSDDVDGFYGKPINRSLSFSFKRKEGLCTLAYTGQKTGFECENVLDNKYNLTEDQKAACRDIKFVIAVPIIDNGKQTKYVICVDSYKPLISTDHIDQIMQDAQNLSYEIYRLILRSNMRR